MKQSWIAAFVAAGIAIVGVIAGAHLFGAEPASAQAPRGYTQCFFGRQETVDIDANGVVATPSRAYTIRVPRGYKVVSGGGSGRLDHGTILFCRR